MPMDWATPGSLLPPDMDIAVLLIRVMAMLLLAIIPGTAMLVSAFQVSVTTDMAMPALATLLRVTLVRLLLAAISPTLLVPSTLPKDSLISA